MRHGVILNALQYLLLLHRALLVVVISLPCGVTAVQNRSFISITSSETSSRKRCRLCAMFCSSFSTSDSHSADKKNGHSDASSEPLVLPIFPLRKTVKMPTESIQLTLWEKRYLALSRCILDQGLEFPLFGALYSAHKSHIIKNGVGPITPLIDVGDIGVVCEVKRCSVFKNNETEVDVRNKNDNDVSKIQLIGLAVGRFRVDRVISNGYDLENGHLPYILVQASRIDDEEVHFGMLQDDKDTISIIENIDEAPKIYDVSEYLAMENFRWSYKVGDINKQKDQLQSFELVIKSGTKLSSEKMLQLLYSTSTKDRKKMLKYALQNTW